MPQNRELNSVATWRLYVKLYLTPAVGANYCSAVGDALYVGQSSQLVVTPFACGHK